MEILKPRSNKFKMLALAFSLLLFAVLVVLYVTPNNVVDKKISPLESKNNSAQEEVKLISINIDDDAFLKIRAQRNKAIKNGILILSDDDIVDAQITYEGKNIPAEIRLKGDWTQHLEGNSWSFRVKLKDNYTINGMRKFSLQHPQTRNYAGEWLFHRVLKDNDIIGLRYNFANVNLVIDQGGHKTTRELGYYAVEEFFDKQLIENNKRREGVILKIDEDPIWRERRSLMKAGTWYGEEVYTSVNQYENLNILPFGAGRIQKDSNLFNQFKSAETLFNNFVDQRVPASSVFDIKKLADFNAICNVLGANHSLIKHNIRVYYNPINSKLEPIGFDGNAIQKTHNFPAYSYTENDLPYLEAYGAALEKFSSKEYLDKLLNWPELKENIDILKTAYPKYNWKEKYVIDNTKFIQARLFPVKSLNIFYVKHSRDAIHLNLENYGRFPVEVKALSFANGKTLGLPDGRTIIPANSRVTIAFKANKDFQRVFVNKKMRKLTFDPVKDLAELRIICKTLGTSKERAEEILSWQPGTDLSMTSAIINQKTDFKQFSQFIFDEENKIITLKQGYRLFHAPVIIPRGYVFRIYEDTEIDFSDKTRYIISFSPVEFIGSKSKPIKFTSTGSLGGGLLVLNTTQTSILENCIFENLAPPSSDHWAVSGGINFYDAPVKIKNCAFKDMRAEDALNIISTTFEMDNCLFSGSYSDAFDGDFVEGKITNSSFFNLGNDAIDVSGSNILLENITIDQAKDKGLSAGEGSKMTGSGIQITNSEIAVASKDESLVQIKNVRLEQNALGFTAFQKKSEFGPGRIIADSIDLKEVRNIHLIENGSELILEGQKVEVVNQVLDRMNGKEFGKKSQ